MRVVVGDEKIVIGETTMTSLDLARQLQRILASSHVIRARQNGSKQS